MSGRGSRSESRLVDRVVKEIQRRVSTGVFAVGSKLPAEPQLMDMLGVGRSTLREAVRVLAHAGVLDKRQGSGTYVVGTPISDAWNDRLRRATMTEIYDARNVLEVQLAKMAARNRSAEDLQRMQQALDRRRSALEFENTRIAAEADLEFHLAIAVASRNPILIDLFRSFTTTLKPAIEAVMNAGDAEHEAASIARHQDVYIAISAGEVGAAGDAMAACLGLAQPLLDRTSGEDAEVPVALG
ncbi:FadR/GntR family transcriptional regulator [Mycobacterium basiliense]|uniref:FadR/GntR family transcriptional regulator n=1 Tax=Mycobacterium basiliense TaxID=2094119 RepID=UPI001300E8B5|nr:FadR/GntR family transcriptional regulator [Mycobacterium basiliense]